MWRDNRNTRGHSSPIWACCISGLMLLTGCTVQDKTIGIVKTSVPTSLRFNASALELTASHELPEVIYVRPSSGKLLGAGRGLETGASGGAHIGSEIAAGFAQGMVTSDPRMMPSAFVLYAMAMPAFAVAGGVLGGISGAATGALTADSESNVDASESAVQRSLSLLDLQDALRVKVEAAIQSLSSHRVLTPEISATLDSNARQNIGTLKVSVKKIGLIGPSSAVNPPLQLTIEANSQFGEYQQEAVLDERDYVYRSVPHHFSAWARNNAALFEEEIGRACEKIARAMVVDILTP